MHAGVFTKDNKRAGTVMREKTRAEGMLRNTVEATTAENRREIGKITRIRIGEEDNKTGGEDFAKVDAEGGT